MSILIRAAAAYLVLLAAVVAVNFIVTPLYHPGGDEPFTVWEILNWFMAVGMVIALAASYVASKALRPDPYAVSAKSSSGRTFRSASPSTTGTLTSVSLPLEGVTSTWVMSWVAFSSWQVSATCTSYPFPLWPL